MREDSKRNQGWIILVHCGSKTSGIDGQCWCVGVERELLWGKKDGVIGGSLEGFFKHISVLASSSETQIASAMLSEISELREEIHVRDGELKKVQNVVLDIKERKRVAIEEMLPTRAKKQNRT